MAFFDDLLDLFLPASCIACGAWGRGVCAACAAAFAGPAFPVSPVPLGVPECWAGGVYGGALRAAILAYKERRRHALVGPLGELLTVTVLAAVSGGPSPPDGVVGGVWLVPVPSSRQAVRARGGDHTRGLAVAAARGLRRRGMPVQVVPLLAAQGRRVDSVGLDAVARRANVAGAFRIRSRFGELPNAAQIVVVDDLVTTGATLAEASRTLTVGGWPVHRAAVLAATERHGLASPGNPVRHALSHIMSPRRGVDRALTCPTHR